MLMVDVFMWSLRHHRQFDNVWDEEEEVEIVISLHNFWFLVHNKAVFASDNAVMLTSMVPEPTE